MIFLWSFLIFISLYIIFVMFKAYKENEFNMFWYNFLKYPLGLIFKIYYPYKVINKKYAKTEGPVIYAGNHIHLMDQCLVILNSNRSIHYLAKKEYFDNAKTKWFFKMVGCIPVNREIHDEDAKNKAYEVLEKNLALGIFPEGTRNKTTKLLLPFKFGTVSMAKKYNATIVPFAVTGNYKFRTKNLKINFGQPFKVTTDDLEKENEKLYQTILNLIKENQK